ncbi:SDR family NAD(P)-dependent oxidoreductase, partial [Streptomyces ziwulingensis]
FPGQGSQWVGMAVELLGEEPVFAGRMAECAAALEPYLDVPLLDALGEGALLERVEVVQPALWAVMVSLAAVWESFGVRPAAVVGHSQGEIAAAVVAGALSVADGARVVALRSRAIAAELAGHGGMVAVQRPVAEVEGLVAGYGGRVTVAAVNGPASTVVSGGREALDALMAECEAGGVRARRVPVDYASHCAQVENLRDAIEEATAGVVPRPARVPFFSTVTATGTAAVTGDGSGQPELDGAYWYRNLRSPVRFEETVRALLDAGFRRFVEVAPHPVLTTGVQATAEDHGVNVTVTGTLRRDEGGRPRLLRSLAEAFVTGVPVRWARLYDGRPARRVELPTYAFQRKRYWVEGNTVLRGAAARHDGTNGAHGMEATGHALLGAGVPLPGTGGFLLTGRLSPRDQPWLRDHAVRGLVTLPGTALLDMVLRAADEAGCDRVEELTLETPLVLDAAGVTRVQVLVSGADENGGRTADVHARPADSASGDWVRHARATLVRGAAHEDTTDPTGTAWPPADGQHTDTAGLYERLDARGLRYGPAFRGLTDVWHGPEGRIYADVCLPDAEPSGFGIHPALLDAALHAWSTAQEEDGASVRLPFLWTGVTLHATGATRLRAVLTPTTEDTLSVRVTDTTGLPVLSADGLLTRPLNEAHFPAPTDTDGVTTYRVAWTTAEAPATARDGVPYGVAVLGAPSAGLPEPDPAHGSYADLAALREHLTREEGAAPGHVLVDLRSDVPTEAGDDTAAAAERTALHALDLVRQWLADERFAASRLVLVTGGAVRVRDGERMDHLTASPVWGLVRSAQTEHPGRFVLLDVLGDPATTAPDTVPRALAMTADEPQLAVRGEDLLVPRLVRQETPAPPVRQNEKPSAAPSAPARDQDSAVEAGGAVESVESGEREQHLTHAGNGTLEGITWGPAPDDGPGRVLGAREVRVATHAVGLNFRDVLIPLGMYPDAESARMGSEGAGVVTETGPGVTGLVVGDRVMGLGADWFGTHTVVDERVLVGIPGDWSFVEAASVPVAFVTAYYALVDVAGVRAGESVLVHAAAGGVGMAAVQLARWLGAEVFATASEAKWPVVRGLGVPGERIASSRTLDFADAFRPGVDVVVDSLAGVFVDASLGLVRPGGRFVELGKADVRDAQEVAAAHDGVLYRAFDLAEVAPERLGEMLREVVDLLESGTLELLPRQVWDVRRAGEAFAVMSRARHVGKLVLSVPVVAACGGGAGGGWVLVSGGSGALGGVVARHLVGVRGVRRLVLLSRRGERAEGVDGLVRELSAAGASVRVVACDVADRGALAEVVGGLPGGVSGVVHAAGVLDDVMVAGLSPERLRGVLAAKVAGAWNLHEVVSEAGGGGVGMFVLFSSAAGVLGGAGQANYAAGNAFLDGLAAYRRARGLSGVSVAWGMWDVRSAMTGHLGEGDLARMRRMGVLPMSNEEGLRLFDMAERSADSAVLAARLDPRTLAAG